MKQGDTLIDTNGKRVGKIEAVYSGRSREWLIVAFICGLQRRRTLVPQDATKYTKKLIQSGGWLKWDPEDNYISWLDEQQADAKYGL